MSTIVSCSGCERKLRVPDDLLGRQVVCPSCNLQFTAEAVDEGASANGDSDHDEKVAVERSARRREEDDYDDRPSRRSRRDDDEDDRRGRRRDDDDQDDRRSRRRDEEDDYDDRRPRRRRDEDDYDDRPRKQADPKDGWKKVGLGLTLIGAGNWVAVGMWGVLAFTYLLEMCGVTSSGMFTTFAVLKLLTEVGEVVLLGLGTGFCLAVPGPARGSSPLKPLSLTAFILACVQALFLLVAAIVALSTYPSFALYAIAIPMSTGGMIVTILEYLVALAAIILLLLFLSNVAATVREKNLGNESQMLVFGFSGYYALGGVCFLIVWIGASSVSSMSSGRTLGIILKILGGILTLVAISIRIWFFMFLGKMQLAVNRFRRRL